MEENILSFTEKSEPRLEVNEEGTDKKEEVEMVIKDGCQSQNPMLIKKEFAMYFEDFKQYVKNTVRHRIS